MMARLIDADKLFHEIKELCPEFGVDDFSFVEHGEILDIIAEQEEVDAVEVVRCKDCEKSHFTVPCKAAKQNHDLLHWVCRINGTDVAANHYCGYGVRRTDDGTAD